MVPWLNLHKFSNAAAYVQRHCKCQLTAQRLTSQPSREAQSPDTGSLTQISLKNFWLSQLAIFRGSCNPNERILIIISWYYLLVNEKGLKDALGEMECPESQSQLLCEGGLPYFAPAHISTSIHVYEEVRAPCHVHTDVKCTRQPVTVTESPWAHLKLG